MIGQYLGIATSILTNIIPKQVFIVCKYAKGSEASDSI